LKLKRHQPSLLFGRSVDYCVLAVVHGFTRYLVWHVLSRGKPRMNVVSAAVPVWQALSLRSSPEHPSQWRFDIISEKTEQVFRIGLIWSKAASQLHTDGSVVFARWR